MDVQASNLALVFGPENEAGKVVRVLWPFDIKEALGHRWVVRIRDESDWRDRGQKLDGAGRRPAS